MNQKRIRGGKRISSPREDFLHRKRILERTQPFTKTQSKQLSLQQKNFIRGIQIARGVNKTEAIKLFKKSRKSSSLSTDLSNEINRTSAMGDRIVEIPDMDLPVMEQPKKPPKKEKKKLKKHVPKKKSKPEKRALKGKKYTYAGKLSKKPERKARFKSLGGTARHYIDLRTGEEISKRERDKRLSR